MSSDSSIELGPIIGSGGTSVVREVRYNGLAGYALKVYRSRAWSDAARAEFTVGSRICRHLSLHHRGEPIALIPEPRVIHDEDGYPGLVMDRVPGRNLDELLTSTGALSMAELLAAFLPVARTLAIAHSGAITRADGQTGSEPLVHLDVKPSNIMVAAEDPIGCLRGPAPVLYLLDFGHTQELQGDRVRDRVGTRWFIAPELWHRRKVSVQADIWSLGVAMYLLATQEYPYDRDDLPVHPERSAPPNPALEHDGIPSALGDVMVSMLEPDPERRLGTMDEVVEALERLLAHANRRDPVDRCLIDSDFAGARRAGAEALAAAKDAGDEEGVADLQHLCGRIDELDRRFSSVTKEITTQLGDGEPVAALATLHEAMRTFSRSAQIRGHRKRIQERLLVHKEQLARDFEAALGSYDFDKAEKLVDALETMSEKRVASELASAGSSAPDDIEELRRKIATGREEFETKRAEADEALADGRWQEALRLFRITRTRSTDEINAAWHRARLVTSLSIDTLEQLSRQESVFGSALDEVRRRLLAPGPGDSTLNHDRLHVEAARLAARELQEAFADLSFKFVDLEAYDKLWSAAKSKILKDVRKFWKSVKEETQPSRRLETLTKLRDRITSTDLFDESERVAIQAQYLSAAGQVENAQACKDQAREALLKRDLPQALENLKNARELQSDSVSKDRISSLQRRLRALRSTESRFAAAVREPAQLDKERAAAALRAYRFLWQNVPDGERERRLGELSTLLPRLVIRLKATLPGKEDPQDWAQREQSTATVHAWFEAVANKLPIEHWDNAGRRNAELHTQVEDLFGRILPPDGAARPPHLVLDQPSLLGLFENPLATSSLRQSAAHKNTAPEHPGAPAAVLAGWIEAALPTSRVRELERPARLTLGKDLRVALDRLGQACPDQTAREQISLASRTLGSRLRSAAAQRALGVVRRNALPIACAGAVTFAICFFSFRAGRVSLAREVTADVSSLLEPFPEHDAALRAWVGGPPSATPVDPDRMGLLLLWARMRQRPVLVSPLTAAGSVERAEQLPDVRSRARYLYDIEQLLISARDEDFREAKQQILADFHEARGALRIVTDHWKRTETHAGVESARSELNDLLAEHPDLLREPGTGDREPHPRFGSVHPYFVSLLSSDSGSPLDQPLTTTAAQLDRVFRAAQILQRLERTVEHGDYDQAGASWPGWWSKLAAYGAETPLRFTAPQASFPGSGDGGAHTARLVSIVNQLLGSVAPK